MASPSKVKEHHAHGNAAPASVVHESTKGAVMTTNTPEAASVTSDENTTEPVQRDLVEWLSAALDVWRTKIDELLVQADLASKDLSDELRSRASTAENAYLAARKRLSELPRDAGANLETMQAGMESLLTDLRRAYESAESVIRTRGSE